MQLWDAHRYERFEAERARPSRDLIARIPAGPPARVLDIGEWNGTNYVVTEYVGAPTLDKVVAQRGPLAPHTAAQVIAQAAVGLLHAHAAGLLHCAGHGAHCGSRV